MKLIPAIVPAADIEIGNDELMVRCSGAWILAAVSGLEKKIETLSWPATKTLQFDVSEVHTLDTAGAWLILRTIHQLEAKGCVVGLQGQQGEHEGLLDLIKPVNFTNYAHRVDPRESFLVVLGRVTWPHVQQLIDMLAFFGECTVAMLRSIAQPSRICWKPILHNLQHAGYSALPIVGLLAFLMGVVISFQGAGQLLRYGANIFIVDLVGLSILRELAPLMTAIIVAGRSGSAFAAQIGTMKVTEEIDALRTLGIAPIELLVLPKIIALVIALPLLTVYADVMGVLGGMVMAKSQLSVSFSDFIDRFDDAIKLSALIAGIGKAPVFAVIIAVVGCYQGFKVGNRSESVGIQTTKSVVQSIFLIIVADAIFSVLFSWLKI